MSFVSRALTGRIVTPEGNVVPTGRVVFTLNSVVADPDELVVPANVEMTVTNGILSGSILVPANYLITIYAEGRIHRVLAGITATNPPDPLTLQAIYASASPQMTVSYLEGPPGVNWRGAWDVEADYLVDDLVQRWGSSYICIQAHDGHEPPDAEYWDLFMSREGVYSVVLEKTTSYVLTEDDDLVYFKNTGPVAATLPLATGSGRSYFIKAGATGAVTVTAPGQDLIDGEATVVLGAYESIRVVDLATEEWGVI